MYKKLAFYYHIPVWKNGNDLFISSFLGVFIDSLASEVDILYLCLHEIIDKGEADYKIKSRNIKFVTLGFKTPAWHRMIFNRKILKTKLEKLDHVDCFIVRSPSPLAPFFHRYFPPAKIAYLVVGDYLEGKNQMKINSIRTFLISKLLIVNNLLFLKQLKWSLVLVNSPALFNKYENISKRIEQIKTTTLSKNDFHERNDTCNGNIIKLLYTGRIDTAKGLFELVEALGLLNKDGIKFKLDIVGWESDKNEPLKEKLIKLSETIGQKDNLLFHKKMSVGQELNRMYKQADIYILPSYHEGFPRTIWEAMANSCPVIATKVGSIPFFLKNNQDAILIEPKNIGQIVDAINNLVKNPNLRKQILKNGYLLAQSNTLEIQTKILVETIYSVNV